MPRGWWAVGTPRRGDGGRCPPYGEEVELVTAFVRLMKGAVQ